MIAAEVSAPTVYNGKDSKFGVINLGKVCLKSLRVG